MPPSPLRFLICLLLFTWSCSSPAPTDPIDRPDPTPGLYFWRTDFAFNQADREAAEENGIRQLYLRVFDVEWSPSRNEAVPLAPVSLPEWDEPPLDLRGLTVVPVVYLTEEVFRQSAIDPDRLAYRVGTALETFEERLIQASTLSEYSVLAELSADSLHYIRERQTAERAAQMRRWQIDYDWTPTSRDRYFAFLKRLHSQYPDKEISVTVRLHQYREREANGIPPADHGLLMAYNLAAAHDPGVRDAVFDLKLLEGYLKAPPYPIPLDAGLPLFSWAAAFHRDRFVDVVRSFRPPPAETVVPGLQSGPDGSLTVTRDTTISGVFLRAGDRLRLDGIDGNPELRAAARLLSTRPDIQQLHFFDWQPGVYDRYDLPGTLRAFY